VPTLGETSNDENELLERLLRIGTGWWRVDGLSSGRSGDVHGEVSGHTGKLPTGDTTLMILPDIELPACQCRFRVAERTALTAVTIPLGG